MELSENFCFLKILFILWMLNQVQHDNASIFEIDSKQESISRQYIVFRILHRVLLKPNHIIPTFKIITYISRNRAHEIFQRTASKRNHCI